MKENHIHSVIGIWLHNFLINRQQYIVVGDALSTSSEVKSGIPQGSVLGPILALIFLADLDNNIENVASMFCDDTRILGRVSEEDDM